MTVAAYIWLALAVFESACGGLLVYGITGFYRDDSGDWHVRRERMRAETREARRSGRKVQERPL